MPELEYVHLDDSTACARSVTMAGGEWKCLTHGRLVRRVDEQPPLVVYPEGSSLGDFAQAVKGLAHANDRFREMQRDIMLSAHEAAARHGFDHLAVDISVRVPPQPELIELTIVKVPKETEPTTEFERQVIQNIPAAEHEALARQLVVAEMAGLRLVGWYCAGGHVVEHFRGHAPRSPDAQELAKPSIRLDDPCTYGVPVYVVERETKEQPAAGGPCTACRVSMDTCMDLSPGTYCCDECDHTPPSTTVSNGSPCEGCGSHLAQCRQAMADVEGRPCCTQCEHHVL